MRAVLAALLAGACLIPVASAQSNAGEQQPRIALTVPAGTPLRLYLTHRVSKQSGTSAEARLLEPLYAFDREVVPAGAKVIGRVSRVVPVSKSQRTRAILNGDFTPLHRAYLDFTELELPDGRKILLHTTESTGLNSLAPRFATKTNQPPAQTSGGVLGTGKQKIEDQIHAQIARAKSIPEIVRGPNKKERAEDYLLSKLPYHPQYVRNGTRFDAELQAPLDFGSEPAPRDLALLGSQPPAESLVHARLLTPLNSRDSKQGEAVEAVLAEPLFSADHRLILPEGTRLDGSVVLAKKARRFHRSGQLRFTFQGIQLPETALLLMAAPAAASTATPPAEKPKELQFRTDAMLKATESGNAPLKVDREGGVQAKESKTRFLGAAVAVLIARRAGDNDPIRAKGTRTVIGQSSNVGGRTLGGAFGFGLLGAGIAQSSRWVGAAFGYYGMLWTLYDTLIAPGAEVQFYKDAAVDIGFNPRATAAPSPPKTAAQTAPNR